MSYSFLLKYIIVSFYKKTSKAEIDYFIIIRLIIIGVMETNKVKPLGMHKNLI